MQTNNLSYVHGSCALPLIGDTLGVFFDKCCASRWLKFWISKKR